MSLVVGVSGTQRGCTPSQLQRLRWFLAEEKPEVLHHGDCIGVDDQAHGIAISLEIRRIVIWPPANPAKRCFHGVKENHENKTHLVVRSERPYLKRNKLLVAAVHALVALPGEMYEKVRSGTWATVRYARQAGIGLVLIFPDGTYVEEKDWRGLL